MTLFRLTPQTGTRLKHPFGELIVGEPEETVAKLERIIAQEHPPKIIAVGDAVSLNMRRHNLSASIYIVDHKTQRSIIETTVTGFREVRVKNPPGEITTDAQSALSKSLKENEPSIVLVDGEEDLLALLAVILAPIGSLIVYGQPLVGIVVIRVTLDSRNETSALLEAMQVLESGKS